MSPRNSLRKTAAVLAGKATGALSRVSRRGGGTTLPGDVARVIDPRILAKLSQDLTHGSIVITGTNGKTTTVPLPGPRCALAAPFRPYPSEGGR